MIPTAPPSRRSGGTTWFVVLLGLVYMVNFVDRTILSVLGEAIRRDLALSDLQLGLLGGLSFAIFFAAVGLPLARLAERVNRVRLIAGVTALWSIMTALSGAAGSFAQLLLCRIGVGVGEAGFTPALVSMLSDRLPLGRRAFVFSLITLGAPVGAAVGAMAGGWVATHYGWRIAFVVVGLPGLFLALLMLLTLGDPERIDREPTPPFGTVLAHLRRSPAFVLFTLGSACVGLIGFGLNLFLIPLLVRRYGLDLAAAGGIFALSFRLSSALGSTAGGYVADALGRRDVRWYGVGRRLWPCAGSCRCTSWHWHRPTDARSSA